MGDNKKWWEYEYLCEERYWKCPVTKIKYFVATLSRIHNLTWIDGKNVDGLSDDQKSKVIHHRKMMATILRDIRKNHISGFGDAS